MKKAVRGGKTVLLSLNLRLTAGPISFKHMRGHGVQSLEDWKRHYKNRYITASAKSVEDVAKILSDVRSVTDDGRQVFVSHCGAVIPFGFFCVATKERMASFYHDMQQGIGGVVSTDDETRFIAFPRLMPFFATKKSSMQKLQGNYIKAGKGKPYITRLVVWQSKTKPFNEFVRHVLDAKEPVYVLATPRIKRPVDPKTYDPQDWKYMFLKVQNNISTQVLRIDPELKEKLLRHRQKAVAECPDFICS